MRRTKSKELAEALERAGRERAKARYVLRLYVTGTTPRSLRAIANVRKLCEEHLQGRYELEVIDVYQQPVLAKGEQIIAVPTLIKKLPLPLRRVIGDMSDAQEFIMGLDIRTRGARRRRSDSGTSSASGKNGSST